MTKEELIKKKLGLWREIWKALTDNFLKNEFLGLSLYNPHILISEIITEIEENELRSNFNREYLYLKIEEYLNNDEIIKESFRGQFEILRRVFKSGRNAYILEICYELIIRFKNGFYFDKCLEKIVRVIHGDSEISSETVSILEYNTQGLIIEFIKKGYIISEIRPFAANIFSNLKFPHGIEIAPFLQNGKLDRERFEEKVKEVVSPLSIEQRLRTLNYYYRKPLQTVHYIFLIEGFIGEVELQINNVTFYNLNNRQFIKEPSTTHWEEFPSNTDNQFIQAAVKIEMLDARSSLPRALNDLNNVLDLISCYISIKDTGLEISKEKAVIVKNERGFALILNINDESRSPHKLHNSIDLGDFKHELEKINKTVLEKHINSQTKSTSKILTALHWYRKAESSIKQEDKLLNYWIAIENLFNTKSDLCLEILGKSQNSNFPLIQEVISSEQLLKYVFYYGWQFYNYYDHKIVFDNPLPEDVIKRANLSAPEGEEIHLEKFIKTLPEIQSYEKSFYLNQKISELIDFYSNVQVAKDRIKAKTKLIKDEVLMIYRFRNLIVHNAHFDNTILPYFVWRTRYYAGDLIRRIIQSMSKKRTLSDVLIMIHYKREELESELKNGEINIFRDRFQE